MSLPSARALCASLAAALLAAGCHLTPVPSAVPCPLPLADQQRSVDEVLAKGVSRDDAIRRLDEAGLQGRFGATESIYYVDTWTRPGGEEWLMEVAVLFDSDGRFTRVRAADAEAIPTSKPVVTESAKEESANPARIGPRTPFAESR